jgi:hypothetical protein
VKGKISIKPSSAAAAARPIAMFEVFVDGRLVARDAENKTLEIDTAALPDGYHELRIVGTVADAIETQGRLIMPFYTTNHDAAVEVKVVPVRVQLDGKLRVNVRQPGAKSIVVRQNSQELGRVQGEAGDIEVSATTLGRGASILQAFSEGEAPAVSAPMRVQVE